MARAGVRVRSRGAPVPVSKHAAPHRLLKRSTRRGQREVEGLARTFKIFGRFAGLHPELDAIISSAVRA